MLRAGQLCGDPQGAGIHWMSVRGELSSRLWCWGIGGQTAPVRTSSPPSGGEQPNLLLPPPPQEEIKDLLLSGVPAGPRPAATIRENPGGGVSLYGAVEKEVRKTSSHQLLRGFRSGV